MTLSELKNLSANMHTNGDANVPRPVRIPNANIQSVPPSRVLIYGRRGKSHTGSIMYCRNIIRDSFAFVMPCIIATMRYVFAHCFHTVPLHSRETMV